MRMNGRFRILFFLCACAMSGCESPKWSQATTIGQERDQPKIIPSVSTPPKQPAGKEGLPELSFDPYDSALIKAVQNRWDELLKKSKHPIGEKAGRVVVKFNLHADGSISDIAVPESTLGPDLTALSQAAIAESAPFGPWPKEMRAKIVGDFRELTFTFDYR
jgi:outer membrane biosynthesis protein TonB